MVIYSVGAFMTDNGFYVKKVDFTVKIFYFYTENGSNAFGSGLQVSLKPATGEYLWKPVNSGGEDDFKRNCE